MKLELGTGGAVTVEDLIGRDVRVEWRDPCCVWEGGPEDFPGTALCTTRGRFMGILDREEGPVLGLASEDVGERGDWRTGTAIPLAIVCRIIPLTAGEAVFVTAAREGS